MLQFRVELVRVRHCPVKRKAATEQYAAQTDEKMMELPIAAADGARSWTLS